MLENSRHARRVGATGARAFTGVRASVRAFARGEPEQLAEQLAAVIDPTGQKVPQGGMEQGAHEFEKALAAAKSGH